MNAPHRRGACPAVATPMPTGDGLLARLAPVGTVALDAFATLCAAARAHGSGIVEVTARGSIQVRGLTAASAPAFAAAVAALGIDAGISVPVMSDPLAGLDPDAAADASVLAAALRDALASSPFVAGLGAKVSVVIDGGASLHLDAVAADVRLRAVSLAGNSEAGNVDAQFHIALGGNAATAAPTGIVAYQHAVEAVMRLLAVLAARGREARARSVIRTEGTGAFLAAVADLVIDAPTPPARAPAEPIGTHRLQSWGERRHDGRIALGVGFSFGHTDTHALENLLDAARDAAAWGIRTAPQRALLIVGIEPVQAPSLSAVAERLGFVIRTDDPRRHIAACAGAPLCASARIPTRALAPAVATAAASLLDGSLTIHLSGCGKGCAHAGAAALTIIGEHDGCGVVVNGSAGDAPRATIASETLAAGLGRLAREVARTRGSGDFAADALSRLGAARIAAILQEADRG